MKDKTKKLLDKADKAHDFDDGQVYGGSGTQLSSTDTCRVCGMLRRWSSDTQHGNNGRYRFEDMQGNPVALCDAVQCR